MPWDKVAAERESARLRGQHWGNSKRRARLSFFLQGIAREVNCQNQPVTGPPKSHMFVQCPPRRPPDLADMRGSKRKFYLELLFPLVFCRRALALVLPHHL